MFTYKLIIKHINSFLCIYYILLVSFLSSLEVLHRIFFKALNTTKHLTLPNLMIVVGVPLLEYFLQQKLRRVETAIWKTHYRGVT